jgi:Flp pilus assembly protein TadG
VKLFRGSERGQATIEVALLLSILLMPIVFGLVEMGFLFSSHLTISASTREGARMGSNLANGGGALGCGAGQSPNAATVDPQIIASVERSLTGSGTEVNLANVTQIHIFKADVNGNEGVTNYTVWTYTPNVGPVVDGNPLEFTQTGGPGWSVCSRNNAAPADALGVTIKYTYQSKSPLRFFMPGFASWLVSDSTVMVLNATQ